MRLLVIVLFILFIIGFLFFVMDNLDTSVEIKLMDRVYSNVQLFVVVLLSVAVGGLLVGILAVAEGASIRIENRRLTKEVQRLETETNYLRTTMAPPRREPDEAERGMPDVETPVVSGEVLSPASAPVYGAGSEDSFSPDDDDAYTGGRAV